MFVTAVLLAATAATASAAAAHRLHTAARHHRPHHAVHADLTGWLERLLHLLLTHPVRHHHRHHHRHRLGAPHVPYGVWDRLAACETGGDWRWGSQFVDPSYQGGIGFATSTWIAYRLPGYPFAAWQATRDQQIAVGRRVLAAVGPGAWGCAGTAGLAYGD